MKLMHQWNLNPEMQMCQVLTRRFFSLWEKYRVRILNLGKVYQWRCKGLKRKPSALTIRRTMRSRVRAAQWRDPRQCSQRGEPKKRRATKNPGRLLPQIKSLSFLSDLWSKKQNKCYIFSFGWWTFHLCLLLSIAPSISFSLSHRLFFSLSPTHGLSSHTHTHTPSFIS